MDDAEQFFYAHAGYSYNPETETQEEGHRRCARALAVAESRLKAGPYFISAEPDPDPWDGDAPYEGPLWIVSLWSVADSVKGELLGAIGSVACEESDPYMRVVAAELANEYLPEED